MKRILLTIEYDGTNYCGWQKQPDQKTIQGEIEDSIYRSIGERVELFGSGRTDAGVHALSQTAHFDLNAQVPVSRLSYILNNVLPDDIVIKQAQEVDSDFHARFSLKKKTYLYKIYNCPYKNAFLAKSSAWIRESLDLEKMKEGASLMIGEHDFKGLCSSKTCTLSFVRKIYDISIYKLDEFVCVEVTGNGFLYNMVRIIVGTLVDYSLNKISLNDIKVAVETGDRTKAGHTMPPSGLYLKETIY